MRETNLGQSTRRLNDNLLLLAGALVPGADVDDAVGVDVERHLDLRHSARGRRDSDELELAEDLVVGGHLALALVDLDLDLGLAIGSRREDLKGGLNIRELSPVRKSEKTNQSTMLRTTTLPSHASGKLLDPHRFREATI